VDQVVHQLSQIVQLDHQEQPATDLHRIPSLDLLLTAVARVHTVAVEAHLYPGDQAARIGVVEAHLYHEALAPHQLADPVQADPDHQAAVQEEALQVEALQEEDNKNYQKPV